VLSVTFRYADRHNLHILSGRDQHVVLARIVHPPARHGPAASGRCMCRQRCPHAASAGRAQMGDLRLALGARGCVIEPARSVELGGITARPRWSTRMVAAAGVAVLVLGLLALKLAQLQVYDSRALAGIARANTIHHIVLEADRGIIYDRTGVPLVQNMPV